MQLIIRLGFGGYTLSYLSGDDQRILGTTVTST